ncbi:MULTISPECIES: ArsR/SmtB family transcription factor [Paenibacillus]|uniref:ArsR/SmtB family transcription factor n=1 Tax=Paenibacillus TaxID=44249 RepID=UPI000421F1EE|nr:MULTISPECIES: metalloregulator ArsR/SmtB family transcription factor [Paenibacillus]OZQ62833.1 ArsR family transcriptional regulator [Paenibacillus taichungensis]SFT00259.1 Rhodanese-related sulfurtransferase [Paenibacillus sp. 453mf]
MEVENLQTHFKERLYHQFSRIGKCLSSDKRLEIMDVLSNGPKSVEGLANQTGMSIANVSRHLQILLETRLVKCHRKGNYVIYSLCDPTVSQFLSSLWELSEDRLSDVKQMKEELKKQFPDVRSITKKELLLKMKEENIILIDVRPADEYQSSHIPNAVSVPFEQLGHYLKTLNKSEVKIVAYCRGKYCSITSKAVDYIQKQGFTAYRIEEGIRDWNHCDEDIHLDIKPDSI